MPDLFTHEISCPEDRAMRKFLWYGALHDSTILSASTTGRRGNGLILRVDHGVLHGIARPGIYQLHFHGVTHTEYAGNPFSGSETIYDTLFLDSALLHAEQAVCPRRRLYHLRITTWAGFIDVVFASFSIRLDGGHVDYRLPEISDETLAAQRESWIRQAYTAARQELALCQADVSDRDLDEYHATGLWIAHTDGDPHHAAELARQTLLQPLTQSLAWQYAAFVLGLHGDQEDLLPLTRLLLALPPHQCL